MGSNDAPMSNRACRAFAKAITRCPRRANRAAAVLPPGRQPITTTSQWFARHARPIGRKYS